jgi:hypothetical protein
MKTVAAIASVKPISSATSTDVSLNGQLRDGCTAAPRLCPPDEEMAAVVTADAGVVGGGAVEELAGAGEVLGAGGIVTPPSNGAGWTDGVDVTGPLPVPPPPGGGRGG